MLSPESPFVLHLTRLEGEQREESVCHSKRGGKKSGKGMIVERGRRRVGGERDVGEEKRKMPPFNFPTAQMKC